MKSNQKKAALPRFILRVTAAAGARGNSPAYRRAQTVRVLFPGLLSDARRGTKGIDQQPKPKEIGDSDGA